MLIVCAAAFASHALAGVASESMVRSGVGVSGASTLGASTLGASTSGAGELADAWLRAKGWTEGFNREEQRLVVRVTESVPGLASGDVYVTLRSEAFDRAMNLARRKAAEFLSAEISTRVQQRSDLTEVIGDPELAKFLTGIASEEAFRSTQELKDAVEVVAEASIAGLYAVQSFERVDETGHGEIAIVATVSPRSADAAAGGVGESVAGLKSLGQWFAEIDAASLVHTHGIRFVRDTDGTLRPVAFAQSRRGPEALPRSQVEEVARQHAVQKLSELHGMTVASKVLSDRLSRIDSSSALPADVAKVMSKTQFAESIALESKTIQGLEPIGVREVTDPTCNCKVIVVGMTFARANGGGSDAEVGQQSGAASPVAQAPLGNCPPVPDNMAKSVRQVRAVGNGKTRAIACESALLEAVRREGATVKGSSQLERRYKEAVEIFESKVLDKVSSQVDQTSKVETFADGFVYSYEVVRESKQSEEFELEICANMVRFDPKDPRFGLPPTVAVMPFACVTDAVRVAGVAVGCEEAANRCESMFTEVLVKSGSYAVLSEIERARLVELRDDIERRVQQGRAPRLEELKLGNELTPDFVLLGRVIRAEFTGSAGVRPQKIEASHMASAEVSAQFVNVATGEVIWSKQSTVLVKGRDLLLVRAGQGLDPIEQSLAPMPLAVHRAVGELTKSLEPKLAPKPAG